MQKTSKLVLSGFFDPIKLDYDFPITRPGFKTPPTQAHIHDCFEIGLCRSGTGVFMIADKVFNCISGDAVFINNREFHTLKDATPSTSDWKFINLDPPALLAGWIPPSEQSLDVSRLSSQSFANVIHEHEHPEIVSMVRLLISELESEAAGHRSVIRSLVWGLLTMLQRQIVKRNTDILPDPVGIQRIYPALQHISSSYAENISIKELADRCHCSISTFRRIFKRSLGCLPLEYLIEYRLKIAAAVLPSTSKTILEISLNSGFATLSSFNRQFKACFKQTPSEYRKKLRMRLDKNIIT